MDGFGPATFGELNAADYDEMQDPGTTDAAVAVIADLAAGGDILELAIGTGRVALPLAAKGLRVTGIEGSQLMVDKLRAKPGGDQIRIAMGDFADVDVDGTYDHVFLVYNTLFNLQTQDDQLRCFANVAERLNDGGTFLIETFVPDFSGFINGQRVSTQKLSMETVWLEAATHDPVRQLFEFQRMRITADGMKMVPLPMRYAWPSELDLMARLAGLALKHRWGGWDKSPFDVNSTMHVSVYQKAVG